MTEIERALELSKYLEEWISSHYPEWNQFYHYVSRNRRNGIYHLKGGTELMDLLNSIMGNIEDRYSLPDESSHLIPTQFASVSHLLNHLKWFKGYVDSFKSIIESNISGGFIDNYIVSGICGMVNSIDETVDRCIKVYQENDNLPRPYQILRAQLFDNDIDGFVDSINGILKGIPYLSRKEQFNEGHFQTMLQILLFVLGFEPVVEQVLSDGRIDMVIKLDIRTYIFELKYTKCKRLQAKNALKQIKDKGYADHYKLTSREIWGVGVSFSEITKNINGHVKEKLWPIEQ